MSALIEVARAKVNLTLRVLGRRYDDRHDLESVVAFADCADRLTLTPGPKLSLTTIGPRGPDCGEPSDNLVLKAAQSLGKLVPDLRLGEFTLDKVLPVAAGIGGGSADAAAALRLLARANQLELDDPRLIKVAQDTGSDVPVCLLSHACVMTGVGETLSPLILPKMSCVMVNPCVPLPTRDVFEALHVRRNRLLVSATDVVFRDRTWPEAGASVDSWINALTDIGNDLEEPAMHIEPVVGDVLTVLRGTAGARLARMSGSGATCFAIFNDDAEAQRAADTIRLAHPLWWVHTGALS